MKRLLIVITGITLLACIVCVLSAPSSAADEPEYTIFQSQPGRLEALLWAIVDCYTYATLEEAKANFIGKYEAPETTLEPNLWPDENRLAALEGEFGDMPEYWQARYFYDDVKSQNGKTDYLEQAMELSSCEPADLYLIADAFMRQARDNEKNAADASMAAKANEAYYAKAADLMAQATKSEPRNAFYCYEAARPLVKLGRTEEAMEMIRLGNKAPVNEAVQLFPVSYILRNMEGIRTKDDGSGMYKLLSFSLAYTAVPMLAERREMFNSFTKDPANAYDTELLNTLHLYSCRFGEQNYASLIQALIAAGMTNLVRTYYIDSGTVSAKPDSLKRLGEMYALHGRVNGMVKSISAWEEYIQAMGYRSEGLSLYYEDSPTSEQSWRMFLGLWDSLIAEFRYVVPEIGNAFRSLEEFRYHDDGTITREKAEPAP